MDGLKYLSGVVFCVFAMGGCSDSEEKSAPAGEEGESCTARADCASGLSCINNQCVRSAEPDQPGADGGAPPPPSRGQLGESCAARSDCSMGLACINNVCVTPGASVPDSGAPEVLGQRGESCRNRIDCAAGLACVNGRCATADFPLEPTGKECVRVQCRTVEDCCAVPPVYCADFDLDAICDPTSLSYSPSICTACRCDTNAWECTNDACVLVDTCDGVTDLCPTPFVCDSGRCVRCVEDTDCATGQACNENQCVASCELDEECPRFNRCQDGACVEVGCMTNRECIAATGSPLATCVDAECLEPCETDLECATVTGFNFRGCVNGYCEDLGCESDEECRIRLGISQASGDEAECRDVEP